MLPAPMVLPRDHCPVCVPIVVRRLTGPTDDGPAPSTGGLPELGVLIGVTPAIVGLVPGMSELWRGRPGFDELRCVLRPDSVLA